MGLRSIVAAAPYVGQLTAKQIIATMLGNGLMSSFVAGGANLFVQTIRLFWGDSSSNDNSIDWSDVNSAVAAGLLPGMMAGTGLGLAGQVIFNIALSATTVRKDGGSLLDMAYSAISSGILNHWGGSGLLAGKKNFSQAIQDIWKGKEFSAATATMSELLNALYKLLIAQDSNEDESTPSAIGD